MLLGDEAAEAHQRDVRRKSFLQEVYNENREGSTPRRNTSRDIVVATSPAPRQKRSQKNPKQAVRKPANSGQPGCLGFALCDALDSGASGDAPANSYADRSARLAAQLSASVSLRIVQRRHLCCVAVAFPSR